MCTKINYLKKIMKNTILGACIAIIYVVLKQLLLGYDHLYIKLATTILGNRSYILLSKIFR